MVFRGGRWVDLRRCNIVFRGGGGADVSRCIVQRGCQGYCLVTLKMQQSVQRGWRGYAGMMSCNAQGATYYSERVSGFDVL